MISDSQMRYGSRVRRHGRSRLSRANQESKRRLNFGNSPAGIFVTLTRGIFSHRGLWVTGLQAAERFDFVIPSEARNLLSSKREEKAVSSGERAPRNDALRVFPPPAKARPANTRTSTDRLKAD